MLQTIGVGLLSLGLTSVVWLIIGTRAAFLTLVALTTTLTATTLALPAALVARGFTLLGLAVGVAVGYLSLFLLAGVGLLILRRGADAVAARLLALSDTAADDDGVWTRRLATVAGRLARWTDRVLTDYFQPGAAMVDSDPVYFRVRQRRAYLHADPDTVNYELQWLHDHLERDDERALEHVEALQQELDADRIWSP